MNKEVTVNGEVLEFEFVPLTTKLIIAGKTEGFAYKDGAIVSYHDNKEEIIDKLRAEGYRIFLFYEQTGRIDDYIGNRR